MRLVATRLVASTTVLACACGPGASTRASSPSNTTAREAGNPIVRPMTLERECWLGDAHCLVELDLDGDRRVDRLETVRQVPCNDVAPEDEAIAADDFVDPPCAQGFWITLATGDTQQVGAGVALAALPSTDEDFEPIPLDADLGGLRTLGISYRDSPGRIRWSHGSTAPAPCDGGGIVVTGEDAAAVLCWVGGTAAAYHLGF